MNRLKRIILSSALITMTLGICSVFLLQTVAGSDPHEADAIIEHNNRGVALLDQYKFKEAATEFNSILAIDEGIMPARVNLGIAYFYDQKYEEATEALTEALKLQPDEVHAHYVLGLIYRNQDNVDAAIEAFETVKYQDSFDPSTNYYLGRLYMRQRDYDTAAGYFRAVITEEPYNASAHYNLATALSRSGKREEGQAEMSEFRRLQDLFGSTTVGLQYLEQGKYAIAIDTIDLKYLPGYSDSTADKITVRFSETAAQAGLDFKHSGPGDAVSSVQSKEQLERDLVPYLGSGIAFDDFDQDGWLDLYISNVGPKGARGALYRNRGDGTFQDVTAGSGLDLTARTMHAIWGDYDNDGYPDLYLVNYGANHLFHNSQDGTFANVTEKTGTGDSSWGMGGAFVDADHDGDLDIFVANFSVVGEVSGGPYAFPGGLPGAPNVLYRNNGDGSFTDISDASGLSGAQERSLAVVTSDLDNTRDIDFLIVNHGDKNRLMTNMRDGTFRRVPGSALEGSGSSVGIGIGDLNRNGFMDVALPSLSPEASTVFFNRGNDNYEPQQIFSKAGRCGSAPILNTQFFDYDNDGDLDVLALSDELFAAGTAMSRGQNFFLLENQDGSFVDVSEQVGLHTISGRPIRGLSIADFDNDGDLDFAVNVNGASPLLFRNDGGNSNNWLTIKLAGTNSNKSAIGVKAEVKAARMTQRLESSTGQGFLTQNAPVFHFGLGKLEPADVVRLLWPNGVLQSEINHSANQLIAIQELDRKGTSCPILYAWDGKTYRFQTDFLGGCAYGNLLAPGVYNYPDTNEYVKLDREDVALKNGRLAVSLNNQLEEVIMFDHVEALVVDHPADYEVYPDEKLLPGPPYQGFRLFSAANARPPVSAYDGDGKSVLSEISQIDRVYPSIPETLPFKGYTELHEIVLDLGDIDGDYAVLLMHAWIDYADSTSNLAASQADVKLVPPYLQVQDHQGNWVTAIERMGFPAGLPKNMTVDLSGRFLSGSRLVRIVTNMKIQWDQILIESGTPRDDYRISRIPVTSAELRYRGYPEFHSPDGRKPKVYDYEKNMTELWKVHLGAYTKFGQVQPLLQKQDDMFVITRSGDEIEVLFALSSVPELPEGWVRDYLIYVDGFGKDMDPNSAGPDFLGPLPFHGMTSFPYPENERYPNTPEHREYLETWNTRVYDRAVPELGEQAASDER
jgi:hypothetical protein